ncbi:acyltransferase family protein [Pseudonocardia phyllosphaerae]|uniref:acyltransferase family protein n=1 Tax=Pseudonocardia phyllosphaerae TaxID=3390502 RepID=UPI00397C2F33
MDTIGAAGAGPGPIDRTAGDRTAGRTADHAGGAPARGRTAWPDAVRVGLTALVVAHHCAVTYSHIPVWTYTEYPRPDDTSAGLLDLFLGLNQAWFMGAFFLVSGWFVPGSVDRHGVAGFVRGRLLRLGVPFLAFAVVLRPIFYLPAWKPGDGNALLWAMARPDPGPLWFVLVLLAFSLVYAGIRLLRSPAPVVPGRAPGLLAVGGFGLLIGVASWLWWTVAPLGTFWPGLPSVWLLPQYALCFAAGIAGGRRDWFTRLRGRTGVGAAVLALLTGPGWLAVLTAGGDAATGRGTATSALVAVLGGLFAASITTAVLVGARRCCNRSGPVARFLSSNAYAVYVLHAPIVAWLGVALAGVAASALGKAALLFACSVVACWGAAWAVRRVPVVRRVL